MRASGRSLSFAAFIRSGADTAPTACSCLRTLTFVVWISARIVASRTPGKRDGRHIFIFFDDKTDDMSFSGAQFARMIGSVPDRRSGIAEPRRAHPQAYVAPRHRDAMQCRCNRTDAFFPMYGIDTIDMTHPPT